MTTFVFAEEEYKPSKSKKNPRRSGNTRTRQTTAYAPQEASDSFLTSSDAPTSFSMHHGVNNRLNNDDPSHYADRKVTTSHSQYEAPERQRGFPTSTSRSSDSAAAVVCDKDADEMEIEEEELISPRTRPRGTKSTQAVLLNFPSNEYNQRNNNIKTGSMQSGSNRSFSSNCSEDPSLYGAQFLSPTVRGTGISTRLNPKNKYHPNMRTPTRGSSTNDLATTDSFSYAEDSLAYSLDDTVEFSPHQMANANSPTFKTSPPGARVCRLQQSTMKTNNTKTELHNLTLHEIEGEDDEVSVKTADISHRTDGSSIFKKPERVEKVSSTHVTKQKEKTSSSQSRLRHKASSSMHDKDGMQRTVSLSSSDDEVKRPSKPNKTSHRKGPTPKSSRTLKKMEKRNNETMHSECPKLFNQWWMCGFADALLPNNKTR
jgi:hypothetical protein